jgi:hypothetical protein
VRPASAHICSFEERNQDQNHFTAVSPAEAR